MKRKRSARFAARLGVLSLLAGTVLAAQAAPAHALCAASCVQQTLADVLTSTTVPDVGPTLQELKNDIGNLRLPPLSHLSPCYEALDCDRLIASAQQLVSEAAAAVQQILDEPSPCYQTVDCNQLRQYLQSTTDQLITQAQLLVSEAQDLISGVVPLITGVVSGVGDPVQKIQDTAGLVVTTAGQIVYVVEQVVHGVPIPTGAPSTSSTQAGTPVMLNPGQALDDPTGVELWDFTPDLNLQLQPEQTTVNTADAGGAKVDSLVQPSAPEPNCTAAWHYDIDRSKGYKPKFRPGGTVYSLNNDQDSIGHVHIEKSETVDVGITVSGGIEADAGVILAKVKTTFSVSVNAGDSWTTTVGYDSEVKPHRVGHLAGGANGYLTWGHYYHTNRYCQTDIDKPLVWIFTPAYHTYGDWSEAAFPTH